MSSNFDIEKEPLVQETNVNETDSGRSNRRGRHRVARIALALVMSAAAIAMLCTGANRCTGMRAPWPVSGPMNAELIETASDGDASESSLFKGLYDLVGTEPDDSLLDDPQTYEYEPVVVIDATHPAYRALGPPVAEMVLVNHEFGNSTGKPFVGNYTPPSTEFTHVHLLLEASTWGHQLDRIGHVLLGGAEVWRTSTARPGNRNITFGYTKDACLYRALFREENEVTFVLDNVVNSTYTGPISVTLKATFYNVKENAAEPVDKLPFEPPQRVPDSITPLTPPSNYIWSAPRDNISYSVPALSRNTTRAVLDVFSSGHADEEFWYGNLVEGLGDGSEHGPVRLVEVYVDGKWAGCAVPYPAIYSGGFSPALWSRIVASKAYDLPSHLIDLTPFLPLLWQGAEVSLQVTNGRSLSDPKRRQIGNNWLVSANLLKWETAGVEGSGRLLPDGNRIRRSVFASPAGPDSQFVSQSVTIRTNALITFATKSESKTSYLNWSQKVSMSIAESISRGRKQSLSYTSKFFDTLFRDHRPLTIRNRGLSLNLEVNHKSEDGSYSVDYSNSYSTRDEGMSTEVSQSGSSKFEFGDPRATSAVGSMVSNYKQTWHPQENRFCSHVIAVNGTLEVYNNECSRVDDGVKLDTSPYVHSIAAAGTFGLSMSPRGI